MIACCCRGAFLAAMVFVAGCTPPPQRAAFVAAEPKEDTAAIALKDLPRMQWREYRVDPYIRAAAKLQGLGKDKAVEALSALARSTRASLGDGDEEVMVLCRLLFVPPGPERNSAVRSWGSPRSWAEPTPRTGRWCRWRSWTAFPFASSGATLWPAGRNWRRNTWTTASANATGTAMRIPRSPARRSKGL